MKQVIRIELPAEVDQATDDASYVGAFENEYGELLIYTFQDGVAQLWHSDMGWQRIPVFEGLAVGVILNQPEHFFVAACWAATQARSGAAV